MAKKIRDNSPVDLGKFTLVNREKYDRVINGVVGQGGQLTGGLGKDAKIKDVIATYDKIGGLILDKEGKKIEMGSFYDFEKKEIRTEPLISLGVNRNTTGAPIVATEEVGDKPKKKGRKVKDEN